MLMGDWVSAAGAHGHQPRQADGDGKLRMRMLEGVRDELLSLEVFQTVAEAQMQATRWRLEYNHRRPHSSLGYKTPAAFAASLAEPPKADFLRPVYPSNSVASRSA